MTSRPLSRRPFCLLGRRLSLALPVLGLISASTFLMPPPTPAGAAADIPNPILFVTQMPIADDFASIGSTFANHRTRIDEVGRGGDLYIRYADGTLRNLTREAGFGSADAHQGPESIAARDPHVHWSGTKALSAMVIGAPPSQYVGSTEYWQLYEITGLGQGETAAITRIANQPTIYNNLTPIYATDGRILFTSDRPRGGDQRHLYPQHDEYPLPLSSGRVLVSHTSETRRARNEGSRANPNPRYDFRLALLATVSSRAAPVNGRIPRAPRPGSRPGSADGPSGVSDPPVYG